MRIAGINVRDYDTIILDRDGTINVHIVGGYVRRWEDFVFIPGVLECIADWTTSGKSIYIVTNQRGIGKGVYSEEDLADIHNRMLESIENAGGRINGIYYSTALTEDDVRRKPGRGMFDDLLREHPEVDPSRTLMVGDGDVDRDFAKNCGIDFARTDSLKREGDRTYWVNS